MIETLWEEIDKASIASEDSRGYLLNKIAQKIKSLPEYNVSVELLYMVAYSLYLHPHRRVSSSLRKDFQDTISRILICSNSRSIP